MSVYVDPLFHWIPSDPQARRVGARGGNRWCHMIADTVEELHAMAAAIGMRREWFQAEHGGHYDLTPGRREAALRAGAIECDRKTFVQVLRRRRAA